MAAGGAGIQYVRDLAAQAQTPDDPQRQSDARARLLHLLDTHRSLRGIARALGIRSGHQRAELTAIYRDLGLADVRPGAVPRPHLPTLRAGAEARTCGPLTIEDLRTRADEAIDDLLSAAQAMHEATTRLDVEQDVATVRIDTDVPVGIIFPCDLHLGHEGVSPALVAGLIQALEATSGLYAVLNGDLIEGGLPGGPPSIMTEQPLRVKWQRLLIERLVSRLTNVLAVTGGQHDARWGRRWGDFDFAEELAIALGRPYLGPGGHLRLRVGSVRYDVGVWHAHKGNSRFDQTAGAKRACEEHGPYDVTVVADRHAPAVSAESRNGDVRRVFMRGGTAKLADYYAKGLNYLTGVFAIPIVILWPDERRLWAWDDLAEGLDYLRFLRAEEVAA